MLFLRESIVSYLHTSLKSMHISKEYIVNADESINNIILRFVEHVNMKICKQIACKAVFLTKHEKFDLDYYKNETNPLLSNFQKLNEISKNPPFFLTKNT